MGKRARQKVSDQLRRIIRNCGMSRYEISKQTGIDQSTLAKFNSGQQGLSMKALDAVGEVLELTVTSSRKPEKKEK